MGAVLLLWTSHSILGQKERGERGSKFESSQQILAGILFIIVWWPGKDIPQRTLAKAKGVVIDRVPLCQHVRNGGLIPEPALRNYYPPLPSSSSSVIRNSNIAGRGSGKRQK